MSGTELCTDTFDTIYTRRAVRNYTTRKIDEDTIRKLLDAAVHAPTAMHEEPWAFAIIQNPETLKVISDRAKELLIAEAKNFPPEKAKHLLAKFSDPSSSIFYNAGTLIVIYAKPGATFATADCWLAAENLMLAARALGLGTCVIGLAISALNSQDCKATLGIPENMTAIAPIIVGEPAGEIPVKPRKKPEILCWK